MGRAVAIAFAKEGADVAIAYSEQHDDAQATAAAIERCGRRCIAMAGDLAEEDVSRGAVAQTINQLGRLDILVNNMAEHSHSGDELPNAEQLQRTFATNVFAMFYSVNVALPQMPRGARIINTASVAAYRGDALMLDYAASAGVIVSYTRSLALALRPRGIRVNAVAPPLPGASRQATDDIDGERSLHCERQADAIAPCYVFLATEASCAIMGKVLYPDCGDLT